MTANRKARRALEKAGHRSAFDPNSTYRIDYKFSLPGGLVRDPRPTTRSGIVEADNEADATRGLLVKLFEAYGYTQSAPAIAGHLSDVVGPFPNDVRSRIASGIIQGTGLLITEEKFESCVFCGAEKETHDEVESDSPDEVREVDDTVHKLHQHEDETPDDCTDNCTPHDAVYTEQSRIALYTPHHYRPLIQEPVSEVASDSEVETKAIEGDLDRPINEEEIGVAKDAGTDPIPTPG